MSERLSSAAVSFCGKSSSMVKRLIAGVPPPATVPVAYIGDECVELCVEILTGDFRRGVSGVGREPLTGGALAAVALDRSGLPASRSR